MAIRNFLVLSTFILMAMVVSLSFASEKVPLRAQDRVEIKQLMWDYIQALDSGNAEAYAAAFAPNGQFGRGESAVKGRGALKKMVLDARKQMETENTGDKERPRMYHVVTNPHIEFIDKDHARYYAYWMGVFKSGGEIVGAGREVNELVRIDGQWFISIRDVDPQD
ncbi:nuclear transport factor 2 family protein [Thermodesulfobacteriota bacterium]